MNVPTESVPVIEVTVRIVVAIVPCIAVVGVLVVVRTTKVAASAGIHAKQSRPTIAAANRLLI